MTTGTAQGQLGRSSRGQWGLLAFVVLALAAIVAAVLLTQRGAGSIEPYSVRSSGPSGLMGLRLWLEDMGYEVKVGMGPDTTDAAVVFLFPGADGLYTDQLRRLADRVLEGTTVVFAGNYTINDTNTFGVQTQRFQEFAGETLAQVQPLLPPAATAPAPAAGRALSTMPAANLTPVLVTEKGWNAVLLEQRGKGTVWHVGIRFAFTNDDLRDGWGRTLTLAALRGKPSGLIYIVNGEIEGPAGSPERPAASGPDGLWEWMLQAPLGWAALLLTGLLLFYLFTQGRRLGPAVVVADPHRRRAAVEHIEAMASLAQRAGHRQGVARYQKARLKRRLGQVWRVSAELDDDVFAASLAEQARLLPQTAGELRELLAKFDNVKDESALVELVDAAARFTV